MTASEIIEGHAELIAEALDGVAFQAAYAARFFSRGDHEAGRAAYDRLRDLCNQHVSPALKAIEQAVTEAEALGAVAAEYRAARDAKVGRSSA